MLEARHDMVKKKESEKNVVKITKKLKERIGPHLFAAARNRKKRISTDYKIGDECEGSVEGSAGLSSEKKRKMKRSRNMKGDIVSF